MPAVHLLTRRGTNWTARFPMIADAIAQLDCVSYLIDAEVIAHNEHGIPDFKALRRRAPPSLYAFDLLEIDGEDVRRMPIETRKQMLRRLILGRAPALLYSEEIDAPAELAFVHICKLGLEGIVSKRRGTAYESGRSDRWSRRSIRARPQWRACWKRIGTDERQQ
jgi:bifunctional non-homologous end joining protein LigD